MSGRRGHGGSAGGGKRGSGLKFVRQEPAFLRRMKEEVGYREHSAQLRDKVSANNLGNQCIRARLYCMALQR